MDLKPDLQDALQTFIYSNLPVFMNPGNAVNIVVSNVVNPIVATPNASVATTISTAPVLVISPELLEALQSYVINNFPDIGIPQDIQQIAKNFLANLPQLKLITPNIAVTTNVISTTVTTANVTTATSSTS